MVEGGDEILARARAHTEHRGTQLRRIVFVYLTCYHVYLEYLLVDIKFAGVPNMDAFYPEELFLICYKCGCCRTELRKEFASPFRCDHGLHQGHDGRARSSRLDGSCRNRWSVRRPMCAERAGVSVHDLPTPWQETHQVWLVGGRDRRHRQAILLSAVVLVVGRVCAVQSHYCLAFVVPITPIMGQTTRAWLMMT